MMFDLLATAPDTGYAIDAVYVGLRIVEIILEAFIMLIGLSGLKQLHNIYLTLSLDNKLVQSKELSRALDDAKGNYAT